MTTISLGARMIDTVQGPKKAWVVSPTEHLQVGRERLERFRSEGHPGGRVDREVLEAVRAVEDPHQLVVFRARSDANEGSWGFADELDEVESRELGYHLVVDQLPTYRRMVAAGVFALIHVEFGSREADAYQAGTRRALDELEAGSIPEVEGDEDAVAVLQVDRWILHNLTYFFTLDFDDVVDSVLHRQLPLLEDRIGHLRELVGSLPADSID